MTYLPPSAGDWAPDEPMPLEAVFGRAWTLMRANWVIALPPIIVVVLCLLLVVPFMVTAWSSVFAHGGHVGGSREPVPWWAMASFAAAYTIMLVGGFSAVVMMFGMAESAWTRGSTGFSDGFAALRTRSRALAVSGLGIAGLGFVAVILALPTLGLSMLAFVVFTIYVLPAVIGGRRDGFASIADSFRLVRTYFVRSAIGIALLLAVYYAISFAGYFAVLPMTAWVMQVASEPSKLQTLPLPPVPLIAACGALYLAITIVSLAYYGYYALVLVGMYRSLVGPGDAVDSNARVAADAPGG